jgi:PAS domain S-box-containing protein
MTRVRPTANENADATRSQAANGPEGMALGLGLSGHLLQALASLSRQLIDRRSEQAEFDIAPGEAGAPAIAVALCTLEGRFLEVNDTLLRLSGYAREEVVGRTGAELGFWTNLQDVLCSLRLRGTVDGYLLSYKTRAGRTRRMLLAARLLTLKGRACVVAAGADVESFLGKDEAAL